MSNEDLPKIFPDKQRASEYRETLARRLWPVIELMREADAAGFIIGWKDIGVYDTLESLMGKITVSKKL